MTTINAISIVCSLLTLFYIVRFYIVTQKRNDTMSKMMNESGEQLKKVKELLDNIKKS